MFAAQFVALTQFLLWILVVSFSLLFALELEFWDNLHFFLVRTLVVLVLVLSHSFFPSMKNRSISKVNQICMDIATVVAFFLNRPKVCSQIPLICDWFLIWFFLPLLFLSIIFQYNSQFESSIQSIWWYHKLFMELMDKTLFFSATAAAAAAATRYRNSSILLNRSRLYADSVI